jgi:hypothetical protein
MMLRQNYWPDIKKRGRIRQAEVNMRDISTIFLSGVTRERITDCARSPGQAMHIEIVDSVVTGT